MEGLLLWLNLMYHSGVKMTNDSYLFPRKELLEEILKGDFGLPVLYDGLPENLDSVRVDSCDGRVSYEWANQEMIKVWKKVVPNWDKDDRRFGTHTGRKTAVLFILLAGQVFYDPLGKKVWRETDLHAACQLLRMCEETLKRHYAGT